MMSGTKYGIPTPPSPPQLFSEPVCMPAYSDLEANVLTTICSLFAVLPEDAQRRVADWVFARWGRGEKP